MVGAAVGVAGAKVGFAAPSSTPDHRHRRGPLFSSVGFWTGLRCAFMAVAIALVTRYAAQVRSRPETGAHARVNAGRDGVGKPC